MGNVIVGTDRLWPKGTIPFKFAEDLDAYKPTFDIDAPVGDLPAGAPGNRTNDVRKVQKLLNSFRPDDGGPDPKLAEDGAIGPKTIAAIRKFQKARFGWQDGRVDPGHATLVELTINQADDPTPDQLKGIVLNAVHEWNRLVGGHARWVRHTPKLAEQPSYVLFESTTGISSSQTGMIGGEQSIVISLGGVQGLLADAGRGSVKGVVLHEMGHAVGLRHEQQRNDRNDWVVIDTNEATTNILKKRLSDFRIPTVPPSRECGAYDFCSMMHYHATQAAKSKGLTTIKKRQFFKGPPLDDPQPTMGNFDTLSCGDIATLKALYPAR